MSAEREGLREQIVMQMRTTAWEAQVAITEIEEAAALEAGADRILALIREGGEPTSYVTAIVDDIGVIADIDYLLPRELWAPEGDMVSVKLYTHPAPESREEDESE